MGKLMILQDGSYAVQAAYDAKALPILRSLPGARWDAQLLVRRVSSEESDLPLLAEKMAELGYSVEPTILARIQKLAKADEQIISSRASDSRLYPFQRAGVAWLTKRTNALLADGMGLGKTVQALLALPDQAAAIVVCPASVKRNWSNETLRWRPDLQPAVLEGRGSFEAPQAGQVSILNYDILPDEAGELVPGTILIADEAAATKNRKAKRTQKFQKLAKAVNACGGKVWLLTGTPMLNRPVELWQILDNAGLAEEAFTHFGRFYKLFNATKTDYGTEWGMPSPEVPTLLQRVMLRREREQVLPELPGKTFSYLSINGLDKKTLKVCDEALAAWEEAGDPQELPPFELMSAAREALARAKIPALLDLVEQYEENDEPLVVFSDHLAPVEELGKREGWATIHGGVGNEQRAEIVKDFQDGKLKGLAMTITAGGLGLTLTRAHNMIFVDLNWVPANNLQAEDRILRIGQANACTYTILTAAHALDERVNELLQQKTALIRATVQTNLKGTVALEANTLAAIAEKFNATIEQEAKAPEKKKVQGETAKCTCGRMVEVRVAGPTAKNPGKKFAKCSCGRFFWAGEKPQIQVCTEWALKALQALAARCDGALALDGQGFNKYDAGFGHDLARRSYLSTGQARAAYKFLIKYQKQLAQIGLWPAPEMPE